MSAHWLSVFLCTADLVTLGAIIFYTTPPLLAYRYLLLALIHRVGRDAVDTDRREEHGQQREHDEQLHVESRH